MSIEINIRATNVSLTAFLHVCGLLSAFLLQLVRAPASARTFRWQSGDKSADLNQLSYYSMVRFLLKFLIC